MAAPRLKLPSICHKNLQEGSLLFVLRQNIRVKFRINISPHLTNRKKMLKYQFIQLFQSGQKNSISSHLRKIEMNSYCYQIDDQEFFLATLKQFQEEEQILQFIKDKKKNFLCSQEGVWYDQINITGNLAQCLKFDSFAALFQAIAAAKIIKLIMKGDYQNIAQKIQQFWKDYEFVPPTEYKVQKTTLDTNHIQGAKSQAKKIFKGMFDFWPRPQYQYRYDHQIFDQTRFEDGSLQNHRFVFHITSTTRQIFEEMNIQNHKLYGKTKNKHLFIHGLGGIGKSTSASLLVALHNYIDTLRTNLQKKEYRILQDKDMPWQQISKYPKYFYFSLSKMKNLTKFYKAIRKQLPYCIRSKIVQDYKLVEEILYYYKQKEIKPIFIIDQINILCSLVRQYQRNTKQQNDKQLNVLSTINQIKSIIRMLQQADVVFSSSQNPQLKLVNDVINQDQIIGMNKITYQKRLHQGNVVVQIIKIIQFQFWNQISKKGFLKNFNDKHDLFSKIQKQILNNQNVSSFKFLADLTHEIVKKSLWIIQFNTLLLFNQKNFEQFLMIIHQQAIKNLKSKYQHFINEGDQLSKYKKFKIINQIRKTAFQIKQRQFDQNSFVHLMDGKTAHQFYDQLFKQHADVTEQSIIIYLSPQTFLQITTFIDKVTSFTVQLLKEFIKRNIFDHVLLGRIFDCTHIQIFSRYDLFIQISQSYIIKHLRQPYSSFIGFASMLTSEQKKNTTNIVKNNCQITNQTSIYKRFCQLFQQFQNIQLKSQKQNRQLIANSHFICAIPVTEKQQHHTSSQCIDFLLISKVFDSNSSQRLQEDQIINSYKLFTFDFCVSWRKDYIKQKEKKAQLFFTKFFYIIQNENTQIGSKKVNQIIERMNKYSKTKYPLKKFNYSFKDIVHTIIVPRIMAQKAVKFNNFTIKYSALQDIEIKLLLQKQNRTQIDPILLDSREALQSCIIYESRKQLK